MIDASVLRAMQAAGASLDVVIAAVEADAIKTAAENEERLASKRAGNLERQQRKRAKSRGHAVSRDVTAVTRDPSPYEVSSTPQPVTPVEASASPTPAAKKPKVATKHRLPADWQPEPLGEGSVSAEVVGCWQPGEIERELSKFRDHHTAGGTLMENWQAAWRKWIGNAEQFRNQRNGRSTQHRGHYDRTGTDPILAMSRAAKAEIAARGCG